MRTRLVVNADDLGLHPEINAGVLRAHREGIVTSSTVLVTAPSAPQAIAQARAQGLPLGVHLALCTALVPAAPPHQVPTVAPGGRFRRSWREFAAAWLSGRVRALEVKKELEAQLARARALGAEPDHLDGHQHLHLLPGVRAIVEELARHEGLPLRWPAWLPPTLAWRGRTSGALKTTLLWGLAQLPSTAPPARRILGLGVLEAGALDEAALLAAIELLPEGDVELGCHPGTGTPDVPEEPGWRYGWESELSALCSPRVKERLAARGVELVSYAQLTV